MSENNYPETILGFPLVVDPDCPPNKSYFLNGTIYMHPSAFEHEAAEGCHWRRSHNMTYIGQGYWRCADCGWES